MGKNWRKEKERKKKIFFHGNIRRICMLGGVGKLFCLIIIYHNNNKYMCRKVKERNCRKEEKKKEKKRSKRPRPPPQQQQQQHAAAAKKVKKCGNWELGGRPDSRWDRWHIPFGVHRSHVQGSPPQASPNSLSHFPFLGASGVESGDSILAAASPGDPWRVCLLLYI